MTSTAGSARRIKRSRATRLLVVPTVTLAVVSFLVSPAHADSPQQQAAALATKVQQLQQKSEIATEAYNRVESQLGLVVTQATLASEQADNASVNVDVQTTKADAQARALYMVGGAGPLYAQVFAQSTDPLDLHTNLLAAQTILSNSKVAAQTAVTASVDARKTAADAARLAQEQADLEAAANAQVAQIHDALDQAQNALNAANAQVRELEAVAAQQQLYAGNNSFTATLTAADLAALANSAPASSPMAARALAFAESVQGTPYQYAGNGPGTYDCSGLTRAAYASAGLSLPRTAAQQYLVGPHVAIADLRPGDLLFWGTNPADPASIYHVAIYAGSGYMVSANHTGDFVRLQRVWWSQYFGATRPLAP